MVPEIIKLLFITQDKLTELKVYDDHSYRLKDEIGDLLDSMISKLENDYFKNI